MNSRNVWTIILVLAIATAAAVESTLPPLASEPLIPNNTEMAGMSLATCDAMEGHCFNVDTEFMMEADSNELGHGRLLGQWRDRYITYRALRANKVPCGKQGNSYYNCRAHKRVNPYTRGCSTVTRCYRWTH